MSILSSSSIVYNEFSLIVKKLLRDYRDVNKRLIDKKLMETLNISNFKHTQT